MSLFNTIEELQKAVSERSGGPKKQYLTLKENESKVIRFLQELAPDGAHYDEKRGCATLVEVWTDPDDYKNRFVAEDRSHAYDLGWRSKRHLLANVAVKNSNGSWEVAIYDQKITPAHTAKDLVEMASEFGTICDRNYRISRTGSGTETSYSLIPLNPGEPEFTDDEIGELYDLSENYRVLSYEEQVEMLSASDSDDEDML